MSTPPAGTVTFLFTDIDGSTSLWERDRAAMREALLQRHNAPLQSVFDQHGGHVFKTVGDAYCVAFHTASPALLAAVAVQRSLYAQDWGAFTPLRVRIGLHTGDPDCVGDDYFGPPVNRVARLMSAAHGGQIVVSGATFELVRDALPADLTIRHHGAHRLKDLQQPETIYEICAPDLPQDFPPLRTLASRPNNLPRQLTSFVGREDAIARVRLLLAKHRLVTLIGIGGAGKTRLALQVGAELLEAFPDGVWLVELGALADAALVPQTVAAVLNVKEEAGRPLTETLAGAIGAKSLLLLLDNCEHLVAASEDLAETLLGDCPNLQILATSRTALSVPGGATWDVPPLSLPASQDADGVRSVNELLRFEAVQLFVERAMTHNPDFVLTLENALAPVQLCRRLEGLPYAIELAAAQVRAMTVHELAEQDIFRLPIARSRARLPHQQTMQTLLDWSYDLLTEAERSLLSKCWVFAGGWTAEAAQAVCLPDADLLETRRLLASLLDKSMLARETQGRTTRYGLKEAMRSYLEMKRQETPVLADLRDRHLDYFLAFVEAEEPKLRGAEQADALDRLTADHDNLRNALGHARSSEKQVQLAGSLWRFWMMRGHLSEGRRWLDAALQNPNVSDHARAKALNGAGVLATRQSDYDQASLLLAEALDLRRRLEDQHGIAETLNNFGHIERERGHYNQASAYYRQSLQIYESLGEIWWIAAAHSSLGMLKRELSLHEEAIFHFQESLTRWRTSGDQSLVALMLNNIGVTSFDMKQYAQARHSYEQSLQVHRQLGIALNIAIDLYNIGEVYCRQGDGAKALATFDECLRIRSEQGDRYGCILTLIGIADALLLRDQLAHSVVLLAATAAARETLGIQLSEPEQATFDLLCNTARLRLENAEYARLESDGRAWPLPDALAFAHDLCRAVPVISQ